MAFFVLNIIYLGLILKHAKEKGDINTTSLIVNYNYKNKMIMFGCKEDVGKKMKIHKSVLWNNLILHNCVSTKDVARNFYLGSQLMILIY